MARISIMLFAACTLPPLIAFVKKAVIESLCVCACVCVCVCVCVWVGGWVRERVCER